MFAISKVNRFTKKHQFGAALVETAASLLVFIVLLLGFFDFILLLFEWGKGVDVLRTTTRQLIVSEPIGNSGELNNFSGLNSCDSVADIPLTLSPVVCSGTCDDYAEGLLNYYSSGDLTVTYGCSGAGRLDRGTTNDALIIPRIRVDLTVRYPFLWARIWGGDASVSRTFTLVKTGEDICTIDSSESDWCKKDIGS
jgi:hypothetical protein